MEMQMKKYRQVSPERAKVWTEKSPKYQQTRKVPVIYYLCRNRQLEHPHFMEVQLSSPEGLYLRDVIDRLNALRGRGMTSLYSWSCKRSYKSGFVWHDLSEDDLILPAHGNEYVLKGSELFDESHSDRFSPISNVKMHSLKQLPEPASSRSHDEASSSSSMNWKDTRHSQEDELSPGKRTSSSDVSPESRAGESGPLSLTLTEYKICKAEGSADASTQTEENASRPKTQETCTRGVSTDEGSLEPSCHGQTQVPQEKDKLEICRNTVSHPSSITSSLSSGGKTETLESLIRADNGKMNSFRILEEDIHVPSSTRLKTSNLLMHLISCGSISVKNHSFDYIPAYKPRFSQSKFPSPLFSTSIMLGELDCLAENSRLLGLRLEDKEYFSGSLVETKILKGEGDGHTALRRSSSYGAENTQLCRTCSQEDKKESSLGHSKCIPRSIKASLTKQPRSESLRSPIHDGPKHSSDRIDGSGISPVTSNGSSKRMTEPLSGKDQLTRIDTVKEEEIKIEERLASGARVIIQSKPSCNTTSGSS